MTHAELAAAVAVAYAQPLEDVASWPTGVIAAFWRNAIARGYLMPEQDAA